MKKILLIISLVLAFNVGFAQQNKQNNYFTSGTHAFPTTSANFKTALLPPVPTTTTSSCMSVNLPTPATWTLTNYGTGTPIFTDGFVNGPNIYGDKEKAMYFDVSAASNTLITQVYVGFDIAYSATPSKTVAVKIYQGSTGSVGAALGTATISMATIMADVAANRYSLLIFPSPIAIASKKFFASVDMTGLQISTMPKDSLSIVSNTSPQTNPTQVWEKWSDNTWHRYTTLGSWNLNISLLIHPFLTQSPMVATFSSSSNTICAGQSVNYNSAGSTAGTYQWNFGAVATPTAAGATSAATYSAAGTYTTLLIVSDACGSLAAAQTFITVNAKPTVVATPSATTICNGTNVTLSGGGASTYTWTGGVTDGTAFTSSTSLNYTVSGTAVNGCTNSAVANVSVNPIPTVIANTTSTAICVGSNVTLSGGGATTYTWTSGVSDAVAFAPSASNSYTVLGSLNNCTNTAVVSVSVNSLPTVTANTSTTSICNGDNVTLTGSGATTYSWTNGVNDGSPFAPSSSNTYTVSGADINGCVNTATIDVTVNNLPTILANTTSTAVCNSFSVTLTGAGASTYTWTNGVNDGIAFAPSSSNTYTVSGEDVNGCMNSTTVDVYVNNLPNVTANSTSTLACVGDNLILTGGGASTYTWTGSVSDGTPFTASASDTYTVTGDDVNGCSNTATVSIVVNVCTGLQSLTLSNSISVFPNPNNGEFTIQSQKADVINVTNELGQVITIVELTQQNNFSYKVNQLQSGIYFLIGKTIKQKVVVSK